MKQFFIRLIRPIVVALVHEVLKAEEPALIAFIEKSVKEAIVTEDIPQQINYAVMNENLEDQAEKAVDDAIENANIERQVEDHITDANIDRTVEHAIQEEVDDLDLAMLIHKALETKRFSMDPATGRIVLVERTDLAIAK